MLTRVEINGFKSFHDFSLDVEPLLMVLGPNSAGKSNLFDALALISRLSSMEIAAALQGGRGSIRDQFLRTADGIVEEMSFAIELLIAEGGDDRPPPQTRFRYELTLRRATLPSGIEALNVKKETLRPIAQAADTWIAKHPEYSEFAHYNGSEVSLQLISSADIAAQLGGEPSEATQAKVRALRSPRAAIYRDRTWWSGAAVETTVRELPEVAHKTLLSEAGGSGLHLLSVANEFRAWRFLHLGMIELRMVSEPAASTRLASDGSNLPTALAALPEQIRAHILADMVALVPGLTSIQVTSGNDELGVEATFSDGQRYSQRVLSDGTLRLLALLTMLHSAEPGNLVAYEEPENGLFPGRLRELLRRLRELVPRDGTLPVQILLNGHSPAIIAGLHDRPESLAFADLVRRKDGVRRTRFRRIAPTPQASDPATTVSMREVEALLDAAKPETVE